MSERVKNCPICFVPYASVRQHCLKYHQIQNKTELKLILNYASGIHQGRLDCPVCNLKSLVRLDKHLENIHHEIRRDRYRDILKSAKQRAKLRALKDLRKSNPSPPMVTKLDLEQLSCSSEEEEGSCRVNEQGDREEENPGPSTSVSSQCKQCSRLKKKVCHLKKKLRTRDNRQISPQTTAHTIPPTRKKYAREKPDITKLPCFEKILDTWFRHITGPGRRQAENSKQRVRHVRQWIIFMNCSALPRMTLDFLRDRDRLLEWVDSLKKNAVTTQLIIIGNVRCFLKFLIESQLPEVKAPRKLMQGALFTLKMAAKTPRKNLQSHRQTLRIQKSSRLVDPTHIIAFLQKANQGIPKALSTLEKECSKENLERVYGLLSGYVICITGHRKGVITNMMVEEVVTAEMDESERRIIRVTQHKTKETFGHALIPLTKTEYMWFYRFMFNRQKYPVGESEFFFANSNGGPFGNVLTSFQDCWENFGLPGRPTFSLIRSSISTCIGRSLEQGKKVNVRRMMCHSSATAEKFYEADLTFKEAFESRNDTTTAVVESSRKRGGQNDDQTTCDESSNSEEEEQGDKDKEHVSQREEEERDGVEHESEEGNLGGKMSKQEIRKSESKKCKLGKRRKSMPVESDEESDGNVEGVNDNAGPWVTVIPEEKKQKNKRKKRCIESKMESTKGITKKRGNKKSKQEEIQKSRSNKYKLGKRRKSIPIISDEESDGNMDGVSDNVGPRVTVIPEEKKQKNKRKKRCIERKIQSSKGITKERGNKTSKQEEIQKSRSKKYKLRKRIDNARPLVTMIPEEIKPKNKGKKRCNKESDAKEQVSIKDSVITNNEAESMDVIEIEPSSEFDAGVTGGPIIVTKVKENTVRQKPKKDAHSSLYCTPVKVRKRRPSLINSPLANSDPELFSPGRLHFNKCKVMVEKVDAKALGELNKLKNVKKDLFCQKVVEGVARNQGDQKKDKTDRGAEQTGETTDMTGNQEDLKKDKTGVGADQREESTDMTGNQEDIQDKDRTVMEVEQTGETEDMTGNQEEDQVKDRTVTGAEQTGETEDMTGNQKDQEKDITSMAEQTKGETTDVTENQEDQETDKTGVTVDQREESTDMTGNKDGDQVKDNVDIGSEQTGKPTDMTGNQEDIQDKDRTVIGAEQTGETTVMTGNQEDLRKYKTGGGAEQTKGITTDMTGNQEEPKKDKTDRGAEQTGGTTDMTGNQVDLKKDKTDGGAEQTGETTDMTGNQEDREKYKTGMAAEQTGEATDMTGNQEDKELNMTGMAEEQTKGEATDMTGNQKDPKKDKTDRGAEQIGETTEMTGNQKDQEKDMTSMAAEQTKGETTDVTENQEDQETDKTGVTVDQREESTDMTGNKDGDQVKDNVDIGSEQTGKPTDMTGNQEDIQDKDRTVMGVEQTGETTVMTGNQEDRKKYKTGGGAEQTGETTDMTGNQEDREKVVTDMAAEQTKGITTDMTRNQEDPKKDKTDRGAEQIGETTDMTGNQKDQEKDMTSMAAEQTKGETTDVTGNQEDQETDKTGVTVNQREESTDMTGNKDGDQVKDNVDIGSEQTGKPTDMTGNQEDIQDKDWTVMGVEQLGETTAMTGNQEDRKKYKTGGGAEQTGETTDMTGNQEDREKDIIDMAAEQTKGITTDMTGNQEDPKKDKTDRGAEQTGETTDMTGNQEDQEKDITGIAAEQAKEETIREKDIDTEKKALVQISAEEDSMRQKPKTGQRKDREKEASTLPNLSLPCSPEKGKKKSLPWCHCLLEKKQNLKKHTYQGAHQQRVQKSVSPRRLRVRKGRVSPKK